MAIIRTRQGQVDITANPGPDNHGEYSDDNTVEQDPRVPAYNGFLNRDRIRGLYDAWNAQYRGLTTHGINPTPNSKGTAIADAPDDSEDHGDNPALFSETDGNFGVNVDTIDPVPMMAIPVTIVDDTTQTDDYFHTYSANVGAVAPVMIVAPQKFRARCFIVNTGNQIVYLGENESRGIDGFPLFPPVGTAPAVSAAVREIPTSREIWAIADPAAAAAFIQVKVLITYERRVWTP